MHLVADVPLDRRPYLIHGTSLPHTSDIDPSPYDRARDPLDEALTRLTRADSAH